MSSPHSSSLGNLRRSIRLGLLAFAALSLAHAGSPALDPGEIVLASRNDAGAPASAPAYGAAISGNGRFVAFRSSADNLAAGDALGHADVFLHDLAELTTTLVSRTPGGTPGNADSDQPSISKSGRYVAFRSNASDLVTGDSNGVRDVFLRDQHDGETILVSRGLSGAPANGASSMPRLSDNGRFVAFVSTATNLVESDLNAKTDVFVFDRKQSTIERISISTAGVESDGVSATPAISGNGRYVAFWSSAKNLDADPSPGIFLRDRKKGTTTRVSLTASDIPVPIVYADACSISSDGRTVTFAAPGTGVTFDDANPFWDVFVRDLAVGTTELVSLGETGAAASDDCLSHLVSGNGRYVFFSTNAVGLVASDSSPMEDIYVRDRKNHTTTRVSLTDSGLAPNKDCYLGGIARDGRTVVVESSATNLLPTATSGYQVFARRW